MCGTDISGRMNATVNLFVLDSIGMKLISLLSMGKLIKCQGVLNLVCFLLK